MAVLVEVEEFREWAGISTNVPEAILADALDEAEAAICADAGEPIEAISLNAQALSIARGEEKRRANRLMARRNSPEGIAGSGVEGVITLPSRDPDSQRAIWGIQAALGTPQGVS